MKTVIEIGSKPYVEAELEKAEKGIFVLNCEYMEHLKTFKYNPEAIDFGIWLLEEQIDEIVSEIYDELEAWTESIDAAIAAESAAVAKQIIDTESFINSNWARY